MLFSLPTKHHNVDTQTNRFLRLSVGLIQTGMNYNERREAYSCEVTYVTNVELGFDYLRDNLALSRDETVLSDRPLDKAFCLVDEVSDLFYLPASNVSH